MASENDIEVEAWLRAMQLAISRALKALRSDPPVERLWFTKDENPPESGKPHATWVWAVKPRLSDDGRWRATDGSGRAERLEAWSPIEVPTGEIREVVIGPASTGGERDEPDPNCKECGEALDDEWRCPKCDTGPKLKIRPLPPEGGIEVEVYDETLSASDGKLYATIVVVGEPPNDVLPVYATLYPRPQVGDPNEETEP